MYAEHETLAANIVLTFAAICGVVLLCCVGSVAIMGVLKLYNFLFLGA